MTSLTGGFFSSRSSQPARNAVSKALEAIMVDGGGGGTGGRGRERLEAFLDVTTIHGLRYLKPRPNR